MRNNTFEILRRVMTDVETELTEELQDGIEQWEFLHDRFMLGTPINDYEIMNCLFTLGYDPRPPKPEEKSELRKEIEQITSNGNKVVAEAPKRTWNRRGGRPKGSKNKPKVNNGKPRTDLHESSV